jgi:LacI family transcriptional regulator
MLSEESSILAPINKLAERVERDITAKGLTYGDRYLTAAEAAREFGVSAATANRAMQLLAERDLLSRERRRGTFVGPAVKATKRSSIKTVAVFLRDDDQAGADSASSAVLTSLRQALGHVNLHFGFVPNHDSIAYAQSVLEPMVAAGNLAGVVAISCQREIYCFFRGLGVPLVIMGSLYADGETIPSIDADNKQSGRLLTEYLISKGHRKVALMAGRDSLPGEHDFYDGVSEVLAAKNLPATALLARSFPSNETAGVAMLRHLLRTNDPPTAIVCRGSQMLLTIAEALNTLVPAGQQQPELVCDGYAPISNERFPYIHCSPSVTMRGMTDLMAEMLKKLSNGEALPSHRIVVSVSIQGMPGISPRKGRLK